MVKGEEEECVSEDWACIRKKKHKLRGSELFFIHDTSSDICHHQKWGVFEKPLHRLILNDCKYIYETLNTCVHYKNII